MIGDGFGRSFDKQTLCSYRATQFLFPTWVFIVLHMLSATSVTRSSALVSEWYDLGQSMVHNSKPESDTTPSVPFIRSQGSRAMQYC